MDDVDRGVAVMAAALAATLAGGFLAALRFAAHKRSH